MSSVKLNELSILENYSKIHEQNIITAYNKKNMGELVKWKFSNNWGASVIANSFTQWRPQMFIIKYSCDNDTMGALSYETGLIKSSIGYIDQITVTELAIVLAKLQGMPKKDEDVLQKG